MVPGREHGREFDPLPVKDDEQRKSEPRKGKLSRSTKKIVTLPFDDLEVREGCDSLRLFELSCYLDIQRLVPSILLEMAC